LNYILKNAIINNNYKARKEEFCLKKIYILILSLLFLFSSVVTVQAKATQNPNITIETIYEVKNNVKATGVIPSIVDLKNPIFQYKLNYQIKADFDTYFSNAPSNKIKNFKVSYEAIDYNDILSLVVYYTNSITDEQDVKSYVIDKSSNSYITINDVLGENGLKYCNKVIENKIKTDKDIKYLISSPDITDSQAFYVKDGNIVVVFGSGKAANAQKGTIKFEVPKSGISNFIINSVDCYLISEYNVKMVPLRAALEYFGYTVLWSNAQNTVAISKDSMNTKITIGRNSYYKPKNSPKQLEAAPQIKNGKTYVPISFYNDILGLLFAVDSNGNVVISQYVL